MTKGLLEHLKLTGVLSIRLMALKTTGSGSKAPFCQVCHHQVESGLRDVTHWKIIQLIAIHVLLVEHEFDS